MPRGSYEDFNWTRSVSLALMTHSSEISMANSWVWLQHFGTALFFYIIGKLDHSHYHLVDSDPKGGLNFVKSRNYN
jgi:hypothetical protein